MAKIFAPSTGEIMQDEKDHMELSRKLAAECMVLLENDGTLPLTRQGKLALYGAGARRTVKGGTGSGDVNSRSAVTIEEGLEKVGFTITTKDWLERHDALITKSKEAHRKDVEELAGRTGENPVFLEFSHPYTEPAPEKITEEDIKYSDTDTAIYVIARNSGEGADRWDREGDYKLWPEEKASLKLLAKSYKKFILVLNVGGVMDLSEIRKIDGINAIVLMSQLGNIGGLALADLVIGVTVPSGKLTDTWAADYADYPSSSTFSHNNGDVDDDNYTEGIYVGYRYFDTAKKEPLYPFGYGLSYTQFNITPKNVEYRDGRIYVTAAVTNIGGVYSGKEVVEVYVSAPEGSLDKPYQELKGYTKTPVLAPGETQEVTVDFPVEVMASYSEKAAAWMFASGDYIIRVGNSSRNTKTAAVIRLDKPAVTEQCRNVFVRDNDFEELKIGSEREKEEIPDSARILLLAAADIPSQRAGYSQRQEYTTDKTEKITLEDVKAGRATVEELVSQLSVREMARLATGKYAAADDSSVIGMASQGIPGAAGDTSDVIADRGVRSVSMADGPAGLRLQPHFKARHDGTILPGGQVFGDAAVPFPEYDHPEDVVDYYQYATAIPIGWALAQSWNTELVREAGYMVGSEMEKFGVDIWLAPAMNIHRNPLCGRNFEYYSEDPVVAGRTAAAMVMGVQAHKGKGVSVKHFAANSQEDNRYCTNAHVSERAMREIYLRGFEITVRESQPMTIMTSYNMINGVHTPDSYDLLQTVARDEWQFRGSFMTDWYSTEGLAALSQGKPKYPWGNPTGAVHAGNDLQMPGSRAVEDRIVDAVENGTSEQGFTATKADLQFCAANVIRTVLAADEK